MRRVRVIPVLLIQDGGLVKSIKFKNHKYVGDPINAVKIFNEKEVDEIVILDISATKKGLAPNIAQISEIAGEAFMPLAYGGGITKLEEIKQILFEGAEKVVINTHAFEDLSLITKAAQQFGSQSIVASIDVKKNWLGKYKVYSNGGQKNQGISPIEFAKKVAAAGVGEIMLTSINQDGTFDGYDLKLTQMISDAVNIPLIACGGARTIDDFRLAVIEGKASAIAAGSMFVYQGIHRAVLISYPAQKDLKEKLFKKL